MAPHSNSSDAILNVRDISRKLLNLCPSPKISQFSLNEFIVPAHMSFPPACGISSELQDDGIPSILASEISDIYLRFSEELREGAEMALRRALTKARQADTHSLLGNDRSVYQVLLLAYKQNLARCTNVIRQSAHRHLSSSVEKAREKRPNTFNQASRPMLEDYFENNAYPTISERKILAKRTSMTERQIEVWFQNHRSRAKKEGKILRRRTADTLHLLSNFTEETVLKTFDNSCESSDESIDSDAGNKLDSSHSDIPGSTPWSQFIHNNTIDVLNPPAPSHAFPTIFPPPGYDHNRNESNLFKSAPLDWPRKQSSHVRSSRDIPFDDFVTFFAMKLSFKDIASERLTAKNQKREKWNDSRWTLPTLVIPPPAPLPALIPVIHRNHRKGTDCTPVFTGPMRKDRRTCRYMYSYQGNARSQMNFRVRSASSGSDSSQDSRDSPPPIRTPPLTSPVISPPLWFRHLEFPRSPTRALNRVSSASCTCPVETRRARESNEESCYSERKPIEQHELPCLTCAGLQSSFDRTSCQRLCMKTWNVGKEGPKVMHQIDIAIM